MNDIEFRSLVIPTSLESTDAADFTAMTEVRNAVYREVNGNEDDTATPAELLPHYQPSPDELRFVWLILADGVPVGRIGVDIPLEEDSRVAYWLIEILASHNGRGIGTAAYDIVERAAREHGRSVLQSWVTHPERGPARSDDRLAPPTGFGTIPRDHRARFYLRHGYSLEQVERKSVLALPVDSARIEEMLGIARTGSYSVVQWMLPTPPEFVDGYARMKNRMSTDVPAGALEFDEEDWDADRVARHDDEWLGGGKIMLVTAAKCDGTGELVGYTELSIGNDRTAVTSQEDTLVLREHRGNKIGQLIKCAGLLSWRDIAPESPKLVTYNAEENRFMLDVNEAMGFVPDAYVGAWKKTIDLA